ncbi:alpha/beta hydrolase [Streptomyces spectabilis]|uniref:Alpha/beta hydrolase n=1 Tax=Streptomyces spectabilis TaxID=68270 RepID=A0A516RJY6_STRST|nr:alpha/beta hydrolase [Streptomyces spectabilis]QDQ15959.1 alpha/beta hydrolase [Streptomyces spectabilis]
MARPARRRHLVQRRHLAPLLALGVTAALVPQLALQSVSAAAPAAEPTARQLAPFTGQKPTWKPCAADLPATLQCATLKVPLDYRRPGGERIDIAISRARTSVPGKRRGIMAFNPGGPGGPGLDFPDMAAKELPKQVTERYDLIGFDPRGVGESTPVTCGLGGTDLTFPRPNRSRREFDANTAWSKKVARACRVRAGGLLPHITTRNTARDMDVMRAALGEKKLSYYGLSYGSALGAAYMQLFPGRADRFVVDSAIDSRRMWRGMYRVWAPSSERAFERWAKWTAERASVYHLGGSPEQVRGAFWSLVKHAEREPVELSGAKYDGAGIRDLMRAQFVKPRQSAELVVKLKQAASGQPVPPGPAAPPAAPPGDNAAVSQWAVVCADGSDWPRDVETYRRDVARDSARYPLYGDFVSGISPCAYWPKATETAGPVSNRVPALIVQNEWDPQTPLSSARSLHRDLKGSRLVTVRGGEGHSVRFYTATRNACADRQVDAYLITGELPREDVTCRAAPDTRKRSAAAPLGLGT